MDEEYRCVDLILAYGMLERSLKTLSSDVVKEIEDPSTVLSHKDGPELKRILGVLKLVVLPNMYKRIHEHPRSYDGVDLYNLKRTAYEVDSMVDTAADEQAGSDMLRPLEAELEKICDILADDPDSDTQSETASSGSFFSHAISKYEVDSMVEGVEDEAYVPLAFSSRYDRLWYGKDTYIVGRESERTQILDWILNPSSDQHPNVIAVCGDAGMGKTTLVKTICSDVEVSARFDLVLFHTSSGDPKSRVVEIIRSITRQSWFDLHRMETGALMLLLRRLLAGRVYLLVLDNYEFGSLTGWEELRQILEAGSRGSTVIVTTCTSRMYPPLNSEPFTNRCLELQGLTENDSWSLFTRCGGFDQHEYPSLLRDIGTSLVHRCRGCPLAVKTLGSLLRVDRDEHSWMQIKDSKIWTMLESVDYTAAAAAFTISIQRMSPDLLQCLSLLSVLSESKAVSRDHVMFSWMALGLLHSRDGIEDPVDIGHAYFNELLIRSAIQLFQSDGHDMVLLHTHAQQVLDRISQGEEVALLPNIASVPENCRHLIWNGDLSSLGTGFAPGHSRLPMVRTFLFRKYVGPVKTNFLKELIAKLSHVRVLLLDGSEFRELPESIGSLQLLRYLSLAGNHKLKRLPKSICKLLKLQTLDLSGCEQLKGLPENMPSLRHLDLSGCEHLKGLPGNMPSLRHLFLSMNLDSVPVALHTWSSLHHLKLCNCPMLKSITMRSIRLLALRVLQIHDCPLIASLPKILLSLPTLKEISIHNCQMLDLTGLDGFYSLECLQFLWFHGLPRLNKFPEGLLYDPLTLRHLIVSNCENLTALPESLDRYQNLLEMVIDNCPKIVTLPTGIRGITTLQLLKIVNCPNLAARCASGVGEDWHLISHIPKIQLQHQVIQTSKEHPGASSSTTAPPQGPGTSYQEAQRDAPRVAMKQIAMKIDVTEESKAMVFRNVSKMKGVKSIEVDVERKVVVVVGTIQPISTFKVLKKIRVNPEIISVGPVKPKSQSHEKRWDTREPEPDVEQHKRPFAGDSFQEDTLPPKSTVTEEEMEKEMKDSCSILILLPEKYEIEKDTLIQLWMAGDYIKGEPMELKGERYFDFAVDNGYLSDSGTNFMTGKSRYRKNKTKTDELLDSPNKHADTYLKWDNEYPKNSRPVVELIQHVSLVCNDIDERVFQKLQTPHFNKLRTLLFLGHYGQRVNHIPNQLLMCFENLQALDLSRTQIRELPSSIGHNIHLRYLDLSWTLIEWLPDIICSLVELQTLKLRGCSNLGELPEQLQRLTKLRHLEVDVLRQFETMPKGIGSLVNLRTLSAFLVDTEDGCSLRELKELNALTGHFCIAKLEHVENVDEAREAALCEKEQLEKLELRWTASELCGSHHNSDVILECLEPSTRLKELHICCYDGIKLPSWINTRYHLVRVVFYRCENVSKLPLIEQLPLLKRLELVGLNKVVEIERRGSWEDVAFPILEELEIDEMQSLRRWDWKKTNEGDFARLTRLTISDCPKLVEFGVLPHLASIKHFEIRECPKLQSLSSVKLPDSLEELIVEDCPKIQKEVLGEGRNALKMNTSVLL